MIKQIYLFFIHLEDVLLQCEHRAVLYFSKIEVILREVVLRNKPKAMLIASEKGTVPVLVLKDKVIDESLEIIIWALNIRDNLNLLEPYKKEKKMY